ncbi:MAG TPA: hypothetical protein VEY88_18395 [Archangium sp.]|nr:hypothetical protein [Archangium sp.]
MSHPDASELGTLVRQFYPTSVASHDPVYGTTTESLRREARRIAAQHDSSAWQAFLQRLQRALPGCGLWDQPSLLYYPCRNVRVYLPDSPMGASSQDAVVLLKSVLGPFHALHASHQRYEGKHVVETTTWFAPLPERFRPLAEKLDTLASSELGSTRLTADILLAPIPDIQVENVPPGETKLIHCLFTSNLW